MRVTSVTITREKQDGENVLVLSLHYDITSLLGSNILVLDVGQMVIM